MSTFKHIQVSELQTLMTDNDITIADIRDPNAFAAGHIKGAIHLTNESINDFIQTTDIDSPVIVCCYHGNASQQAAQFLVSQDFTNVYSLDGGFSAWQLQHPELTEQ